MSNPKCPEHDVELAKKRVMYGLPDPKGNYDDVILGGCCIPPHPYKFGYECPVDKEVFYLDEDEELDLSNE